MPFTDWRVPGTGRANALGAYEQALLIWCIYDDRQDLAETILATCGGGRVVQWVRPALDAAPAWAIFSQGHRYYVVFEGTTNSDQAIIHVAGAIGAPFRHGSLPGTAVHALHNQVELLLRPLIFAAIPSEPDTEVWIAGHSYGGSIAQILSYDVSEPELPNGEPALGIGQDRIHVLTLGQPRSLTGGAPEPCPDYQRVNHDDDPVPSLPPSVVTLFLVKHKLKGSRGTEYKRGWHHYGTLTNLADNAALYPPRGDEESVIEDAYTLITNPTFAAHSLTVYADLLRRASRNSHQDDSRVAVLGLVHNALINAGPIGPGWTIPPQTRYINAATANTVYPGPASSPITTADIPGAQNVTAWISNVKIRAGANTGEREGNVANRYWRITAFLGNTESGDSQTVTLKAETSVPIATVVAIAKTWVIQRAHLFGAIPADIAGGARSLSSPAFTYMRITDAKNPRNTGGGLFKLGGAQFMGYGIGLDDFCDRLSTSLPLVMQGAREDDQRLDTANHVLTGMPDAVAKNGVFNSGYIIRPATSFLAQLKLYLAWLTTDSNGLFGFMGADVTNTARATGTWVSQAGSSWFVPVDVTGWATGDTVVITGANSKGLNGTSQIQVVTGPTQGVVLTNRNLRTDVPAPTKSKLRRTGIVGAAKPSAFYRYKGPTVLTDFLDGLRLSKKNLGKEFNPASFRRRRSRV